MGILKKKKSSIPKVQDTASLDAAMSELSKQTEALLGSFQDQAESKKPQLPKKNQKTVVARGKSFDIIHDPKRTSKLHATLKAAPAKKVAVVAQVDAELLLPPVATKSYNELTSSGSDQQAQSKKKSSTPQIINHHESTLSVGTISESQSEPQEVADQATPEQVSKMANPAAVSHNSIVFEEPAQKEATDSEETEQHPDESALKAQNTSELKDEPKEDQSYTSGELFANNLVKNVKPKGYQPEKETKVPAVFDTEEYHVELHDWSKLEHKNGGKIVLLLLLLVVAAVAGCVVLFGYKLPF